MDLQGILFDFDGVVLNSMDQHLQAWQFAFRRAGIELDDLEFYKLEGRGVRALATALIHERGLPENLIERIATEKAQYYEKIMRVDFFDGFFDLLDYLKNKQIRMGIVTGGSRDRIEPFAERYLQGYFEGFVTADDVKNTKPHPEPYLSGLQTLGLAAQNCLVIENAPLGIESAKKAGMQVLAIQTTLGRDYLKQADHIFDSFGGIQKFIANILKK